MSLKNPPNTGNSSPGMGIMDILGDHLGRMNDRKISERYISTRKPLKEGDRRVNQAVVI